MLQEIPVEAWAHATNAVFRDGVLYPDVYDVFGGETVAAEPATVEGLSHFTIENYALWAGASVLCVRAPSLEGCMFRFDDKDRFALYGYTNPWREPGCPDWYMFWVKHHPMGALKRFARQAGLIPRVDLPLGRGGYGIDTGLRAHPYRGA